MKGVTKDDLFITFNKKDSRTFRVSLDYTGPIKAPIKKDQKIAILRVYNKDVLLNEVQVYAFEKVNKINFFKSVFTSLNYMIWGDV